MTELTNKLKKAQYQNVVKKAAAGKVLSDREMQLVEDYEKSQEPVSGSRFNWIHDVSALADFLGVTVMTISNYNKSGMPKLERGKYDLKACWRWWLENIAMPRDATPKAKDHHERYMTAKADNEEIKRDRLRELLVIKDRVIHEFAERAADLKTTLRAYRYRMAPILEGKTGEEIAHILGQENDRMLENFCRNGKYIDGDIKPTAAPKRQPAKRKKRKA